MTRIWETTDRTDHTDGTKEAHVLIIRVICVIRGYFIRVTKIRVTRIWETTDYTDHTDGKKEADVLTIRVICVIRGYFIRVIRRARGAQRSIARISGICASTEKKS